MRLLKVHSLTFEEFANERATPKYGILSHRWESQEVSYQDMLAGSAQMKKGFVKIKAFCNHCALDGLSHGWIDTCCIDRGSSAELSEAINSMYRWYQNATKCYGFLSDVDLESSWPLKESEWFKRGWTLQELIAPSHVEFYDSNWTALGSKRQMADVVSDITKIPANVLLGEHPRAYSIAQRMSWAANRVTTRIEDQAYSLMGLFDVNMPMLYGEGDRAFIRLQEEIIKYSGDHSIFAWPGILSDYDKAEMYDVIHEHQGGLLAKSPFAFALCGNIQSNQPGKPQQPFALTNLGLSIELLLRPCSIDTYQAKLDCCLMERDGTDEVVANISIYLRQTDQDGQYVREVVDGSSTQLWRWAHAEHRRVRVNVIQAARSSGTRLCRPIVRFANGPIFEHGRDDKPLATVSGPRQFDIIEKTISLPPGMYGTVALVSVQGSLPQSPGTLLRLGFDFDFNPRLYVDIRGQSDTVPGDYTSSEWMSSVSWSVAFFNDAVSRFVATEDDLNLVDGDWAFHGHRNNGLLVFLYSLNAVINIEKRDLIYERFWTVDIQRISLDHQHLLTVNRSAWASIQTSSRLMLRWPIVEDNRAVQLPDRCPICSSFLHTPISTECGHTFCQSCIDWADISVASADLVYVPLEYNEFPTTDSRRNDQEIACPLCESLTTVYYNSRLQEALQVKYPGVYRTRLFCAPGTGTQSASSNNRSSALETLTLLIGNTHKLTENISPILLQADPLRENKHDWTFFVRPSNKNMVEEVIIHLHKSFRNNKISLRHPPFEVRRWGWGYFTIRVEVILKPGHTILHDEAVDTTEGGHRNRLDLMWELNFDNDGAQGKLRVKIQKHRSTQSGWDERLMEQFSKIRMFQRVALGSNADAEPHQMDTDHVMSVA